MTMKNWILSIVFLMNWCAFGQTAFNYKKDFAAIQSRSKDKNDKLFYDSQLKRFLHNDATQTDFDVLALMIGFTATPHYNPNQNMFRESIIDQLSDEKKYADALDMANRYLKVNPVSIRGIYGKSFALLQLQQRDSANHYARQWQKILKAMFLSGKGTSISDATFAMEPEDGKLYISRYVGAEITAVKSGKDADGNVVAIYDVILDKKKLTLYFMIQHGAKIMAEDKGK